MERESFVFYKSYFEAVKDLDIRIQTEVHQAIMTYALYGIEPELLKPIVKGFFIAFKPQIDANNKRYLDGQKGGRKPVVSVSDKKKNLM